MFTSSSQTSPKRRKITAMLPSRRHLALIACLSLVPTSFAFGQDSLSRGRKYKAPPPTSHIEVWVTKKSNGKPVVNAAVVFDSKLDGKEEGNLEVKTDPEGKATIDLIPTGSTVRVQVIATGFATYAEEYEVPEASRKIDIALIPPREQVSSYVDNQGKGSERKAGVQEPSKPKAQASGSQPASQLNSLMPDINPKQ